MRGLILSHRPEEIISQIRGEKIAWLGRSLQDPIMNFDSLVEFCQSEKFDVIVGGGSEEEKRLLSRLCTRLSYPIFTNCLRMEISEKIHLFRADASGKKLDVFSCASPCLVSFADTFSNGKTEDPEPAPSRIPALSRKTLERLLEDPHVEILVREPLPEKPREDILVCVGRGAGERGVRLAKIFAEQIGAALGCTRAVVEDGWMDRSFQIGQSGKSVAPELYIGFGVSGAFQHQVGMSQSQRIIGVNVNPNVPLFSISETGLIADAREVLQILVDKKKFRLAK